jgi:hypothetical protein
VLAIVAYRQPIARSGIEHIRGSATDGAIATCLERGLIAHNPHHLFVTTPISGGRRSPTFEGSAVTCSRRLRLQLAVRLHGRNADRDYDATQAVADEDDIGEFLSLEEVRQVQHEDLETDPPESRWRRSPSPV